MNSMIDSANTVALLKKVDKTLSYFINHTTKIASRILKIRINKVYMDGT